MAAGQVFWIFILLVMTVGRWKVTANSTFPTPETFDSATTASSRTDEDESTIDNSTTFSPSTFHIELDSDSPDSALIIHFSPSTDLTHYKANYSDLSAINNGSHSSPSSALFSSSPYRLAGLTAGHQFKVEIYGFDKGDNPHLVQIEVVSTAPSTPAFNLTSVSTTNDSITLVPQSSSDDLGHQYYFLRYESVDGSSHQQSLNFSDAKKPIGSLNIDRLVPGRVYNLSVFMINKSGLWSKPWNSVILTNPNPPTNVSVRERGTNHLLVEWKRPQSGGVDEYHISYQDIRGGNPTDIPLIPAANTSIPVSKGIDPGRTYFLSVYSLKGSKSSSQATITAVARPLPPTSIEVQPDFDRLKFRIRVVSKSEEANVFSGCRLEVSALINSFKANETAAAQENSCDFYAELTPGDSYTFRGWTLSGQEETASSEYRVTNKLVQPAFDEKSFGVKMTADPTSVRVVWDQTAILKYWKPMVGMKGNFSGRLRSEDGGDVGLQMASPVGPAAVSQLSFGGLAYGTCYSVELCSAVDGVISNRSSKHIRTAIPETTVAVKSVAARSVDLQVELVWSATKISLVDDGSNLAVKPSKEDSPKKELPVSLDRSCRIMVQLSAENGTAIRNETLENLNYQQKPWPVRFLNLQPFRKYSVSVVQQCGQADESHCAALKSKPQQTQFQTSEGFPGPVQSLDVTVLNSYSVNLSWLPPSEPNGVIIGYSIGVTQAKTTFASEQQWNLTVGNRSFHRMLDNLTGGFRYEFLVRAINSVGLSLPEAPDESRTVFRKTVDTPIRAPPKPTVPPELVANSITQTSFAASFKLNAFSLRNGFLTKYAVIVAEGNVQSSSEDSSNETLSWAEVQTSDIWPPYIAKVIALELGKELDPISLVIGVDSCAKSSPGIRVPSHLRKPDFYCNGPLRPDRRYRLKVRGYTGDELFSDSAYSDIVATEAEVSSPAGAIVAGVVIILVLAIVAVTVTLFLRTRGYDPFLWLKGQARGNNGAAHNGMTNNKPRRTTHQAAAAGGGNGGKMRPPPPGLLPGRSCEPILDPRLSRIHQLPVAHTVSSSADIERSRPVRKVDFAEHFRLMSADTDYRFSEEFEDLKSVGRGQLRSAADLPCNRAKNRFTNILPYDHSRVKLIPIDDEEGSEYINGNYIPGFSSPREYIAAQGPLHSTRDDFWRMMWEQNCRNIVNLTRCIEKGREKCDQYWPVDTNPVFYGDVQVVLLNESRLPEWTVRELEMTCGNIVRIIKHFHYTAWPDFGVPDKPLSLVKFVKTFRSKMAKENGPIVVHCSAGVGRSGTFIAIDRLMQFVQSNDYLDIFGTVYEMRKERECMVQTEHQYICIHQVMLCVIDGRDEELGYGLPYAEVHTNPAFQDDNDEGIAESGF